MNEKRKWGVLKRMFEETKRVERFKANIQGKYVRRCLRLLPEIPKPFTSWIGITREARDEAASKRTEQANNKPKQEQDADDDEEFDDAGASSDCMLVVELPVDQQILFSIQCSGVAGKSQPVCISHSHSLSLSLSLALSLIMRPDNIDAFVVEKRNSGVNFD